VSELALAMERRGTAFRAKGEAPVVVRSLEDARDREQVRRVLEGDEMAFRDLFNRYGPAAKSLALRVVRQPFLAEEIVQEAFLVLWREPGAYREERGTFRAWLMSTVHHRAVDTVRREETQRKRAREERPDLERQADVGDLVAEQKDLADSRVRVRSALGEIPPAQRQVLEMMYFEGKTQTTIAQELELPLGTVKSRTLLGMRRLRGMLLGLGEAE
jgi:RNA polymerase sigma factor (sigma-70 family)